MATTRILPVTGPNAHGGQTAWSGSPDNPAGRTYYTALPGATIDVVGDDSVVTSIASQGYAAIAMSGTTALRPNDTRLKPGFLFLDTTLGLIVAWDGANWRNPITGATA